MSRASFVVALQTSMRRVVADPGAFAVSMAFYVLVTCVLSAVWRSAASSNGGSLAGYTAVAFTWYAAAAEAATISLNYRMIEDTGRDIGSGAIAVELLRPVSVVGLRITSELGRVLPRLAGCAALGVVVASMVGGAPPHLTALALAAPSLVLAVACNVAAQHLFVASAFWLRDAGSAWFLYQKLVFVVGGMLIPLEVLPGWLGTAGRLLPFSAMAYAPARLASGYVEPQLLLVQVGWLAVLVAAAVAAFGAGERRLQVVGG